MLRQSGYPTADLRVRSEKYSPETRARRVFPPAKLLRDYPCPERPLELARRDSVIGDLPVIDADVGKGGVRVKDAGGDGMNAGVRVREVAGRVTDKGVDVICEDVRVKHAGLDLNHVEFLVRKVGLDLKHVVNDVIHVDCDAGNAAEHLFQ